MDDPVDPHDPSRGATILHVDMDAFFASVELADRPGLRGRPMVVGGQERGVVAAASYEAQALGVHSGMAMARALALVPSLVVVPPDHERYRAVSRRVMGIMAEVTPHMQQLSIDEAFLDVSGARRRLGAPEEIAAMLRSRIRSELALPASVGVAATMSVAKIASQRAKPDGVLVVPAESTVSFLHALPVRALWGVGSATADRLAEIGVGSVADLAHLPLVTLRSRLGEAQARRLHDLAWGRDPRRVQPRPAERSVSSEHTFPGDVRDREVLARTVLAQCHGCARRLRAGGFLAHGVTIKVRMADFTTLTRSRRLERPSDVAQELHQVARALLAAVSIPATGVRLIGVRADDLSDAATTPVQEVLGESETGLRAVESAMDEVAKRFGSGAAVAASLLSDRAGDRGDRTPARPQGSVPRG